MSSISEEPDTPSPAVDRARLTPSNIIEGRRRRRAPALADQLYASERHEMLAADVEDEEWYAAFEDQYISDASVDSEGPEAEAWENGAQQRKCDCDVKTDKLQTELIVMTDTAKLLNELTDELKTQNDELTERELRAQQTLGEKQSQIKQLQIKQLHEQTAETEKLTEKLRYWSTENRGKQPDKTVVTVMTSTAGTGTADMTVLSKAERKKEELQKRKEAKLEAKREAAAKKAAMLEERRIKKGQPKVQIAKKDVGVKEKAGTQEDTSNVEEVMGKWETKVENVVKETVRI